MPSPFRPRMRLLLELGDERVALYAFRSFIVAALVAAESEARYGSRTSSRMLTTTPGANVYPTVVNTPAARGNSRAPS
jgi:hypothetical protein